MINENRSRKDAELRTRVDSLLALIPRNYQEDPDQLIRVDHLLEQIRYLARCYEAMTQLLREEAKTELWVRLYKAIASVSKLVPELEIERRMEHVWARLKDPPHEQGCACPECVADIIARA